ncbi:hypothetical protein C1646_772553 [Rhizophagus diaphanus]|nr:hypothetical protein C1646_772553 [Rhizophagus diaphanus] [Rhizophagus sp. MUCL 43196]
MRMGKKPGRTKPNDQDLKKKNELWKPGCETKLNNQDLKEQTMTEYGRFLNSWTT